MVPADREWKFREIVVQVLVNDPGFKWIIGDLSLEYKLTEGPGKGKTEGGIDMIFRENRRGRGCWEYSQWCRLA